MPPIPSSDSDINESEEDKDSFQSAHTDQIPSDTVVVKEVPLIEERVFENI